MSRSAHLWLRALSLALAVAVVALVLSWRETDSTDTELASRSAMPLLAQEPALSELPTLFAVVDNLTSAPLAGASELNLELIGIVGRLPDDVDVLVRTAEGRSVTLRKGQAQGGWTLVSVAMDRAVFQRGPARQVLTLAPGP